jgi:tetratricopeptide (TPR) repeat protein
MDLDLARALYEMRSCVARDRLIPGVSRLIRYCHRLDPRRRLRSTLARLSFQQDAQVIANQLKSLAGRIPARCMGFYFGLDGTNMADGKGIEFGCSPVADESDGAAWAEECEDYPGELRSPLLSEIYRHIDGGDLWEHVLAQGYCGLALRDALRAIPPSKLLGRCPKRFVCWGFHDGDVHLLGVLTSRGFSPAFPPEIKPANQVPSIRRVLPPARGPLKWVQLCEQIALCIPDANRRAEMLLDVANLYSELKSWRSACRVLNDYQLLLDSGVRKEEIECYDLLSDWIWDHFATARQRESSIPDIGRFFPEKLKPACDPSDLAQVRRIEARLVRLLQARLSRRVTAELKALSKQTAALQKRLKRDESSDRLNFLLVRIFLRLGDFKSAERIVRNEPAVEIEYPELLLQAGHRSRFKAVLDKTLRCSREDLLNIHDKIDAYARAAESYRLAGDVESSRRVLHRAAGLILRAQRAGAAAWALCASCAELACAWKESRNAAESKKFAALALEWAQTQENSRKARDLTISAYLSITRMFEELGDYDQALIYARKLPKQTSAEMVCGYFALAGKDAQVDSLVSSLKTPEARIDALSSVVRTLMRRDSP